MFREPGPFNFQIKGKILNKSKKIKKWFNFPIATNLSVDSYHWIIKPCSGSKSILYLFSQTSRSALKSEMCVFRNVNVVVLDQILPKCCSSPAPPPPSHAFRYIKSKMYLFLQPNLILTLYQNIIFQFEPWSIQNSGTVVSIAIAI